MKIRKKPIIILIVLLSLAGGGYFTWKHFNKPKAEGETARPVEVTTGDIEDVVTAQGKLEPKEYVNVGAQVSGQVEKLYVDIGDSVESGELIAEIDPEIYESQVAGDEARLKTLNAQRAEQDALLTQAKRAMARNEGLVKQKAVSQEVFEDSGTTVKIAEAKLSSLDAQIEEAQSTLEGNKANLNYTKIYAPMAGTVVTLEAREGETLNANQTTPTIVQLADLDTMTVKAQVAEADITKITVGMPVYFTTLGARERKWSTKVRQVLPTPETINDVVLYNVLADIDNKDRQLMTSMSTQMFFVLGRAENVTVIPAAALTRRMPRQDNESGQAYQVKVQGAKGPVDTIIHVGLSDRTNAQVKSGLNPGDKILIPSALSAPAGGNQGMPRGMRGMARL